MYKVVLIIFVFISFTSFGQVPNNRHARLTSDQFIELLRYRDLFVPADVKNDTVIIVQYSPERLSSMILAARKLSFIESGADTTGLRSGAEILNAKWLQKASKYPHGLIKHFKKKGVQCLVVKEENLQPLGRLYQKYWVKSTFVSTQKSLDDHGWVLTFTYLFHDAKNNKDYETFLPMNHNVLELIE